MAEECDKECVLKLIVLFFIRKPPHFGNLKIYANVIKKKVKTKLAYIMMYRHVELKD